MNQSKINTSILIHGVPSEGKSLLKGVGFFFLVFAIIYAGTLSQIPNEEFGDYQNYLEYAANSRELLLRNSDSGFFATFFNEPIWLMINAILNEFASPKNAVSVIIFFSALIFSVLTISNVSIKSSAWVILFLLLPLVLKNYLVHIRQGLAISLFLLGYFSNRRWIKILSIGCSPLIHSSFFFIIPFLCLSKSKIILRQQAWIGCLLYFLLSIIFVDILGFIALFLGARQAGEIDLLIVNSSGLGFIFFAYLFVLMVIEGKGFYRMYSFEISILIFYLATYFTFSISSRIFESVVMLVLLAGLSLSSWRRMSFLCGILFYGFMSWFIRFDQFLMGFS